MKASPFSSIELLERRIAPAALAGQVLTYTDIDGDHVSINISKGTLAQTDFTFSVSDPFGANASMPMQLQMMDLYAVSGISGANVTMKITKAGGGDGFAAIGAINATGADLGTVSIAGDLGSIDAGSNGASNIAIKSLSARSIGFYGQATQSNASPTLTSTIQGQLGSLTLKTDLNSGVTFSVNDSTSADNSGTGPITIGGSIFGTLTSAGGGMGLISVKGAMIGAVVTESSGPIAGLKVAGAVGVNSVVTATAGAIGPVTIGGSLFDAATIESQAGAIGAVKIGGSIYEQSSVTASGNIGAVSVGGSITVSQIAATGTGAIASVSIGGNLTDGSIVGTNSGKFGNVTVKGAIADAANVTTGTGDMGTVKIGAGLDLGTGISSGGALGAVTIGGTAFGNISAAGSIASVSIHRELSAQILSVTGNIGSVAVGGNALGAAISSAGTLGAVKIAGLLDNSNITSVGSMASITVSKSVNGSQILAGAQTATTGAVNIGAVKVGGDWIASNLSAGVEGTSANYGEATNTQLAASSNIKSISIAGIIAGSPTSGAHYGFDAATISSFSYDGIKLKLPTAIPSNVPVDPILADVAIELI